MKAIIVGGGIGGLTTALMLRARGIGCELFEQSDTIRELGVGINTLPHAIRELAGLVRDFPGEAPVYVDLVTSLGPKLLELGPEYRVDPQPDFFASVRHLLGAASVQ